MALAGLVVGAGDGWLMVDTYVPSQASGGEIFGIDYPGRASQGRPEKVGEGGGEEDGRERGGKEEKGASNRGRL